MPTKRWVDVCDKRKSSRTKLQTAKSINWLQIKICIKMKKKCERDVRGVSSRHLIMCFWYVHFISWKTQWVSRLFTVTFYSILFTSLHLMKTYVNIRHNKRFDWNTTKKVKIKEKQKFLSRKIEQLYNWTWKWEMKSVKRVRRSSLNDI